MLKSRNLCFLGTYISFTEILKTHFFFLSSSPVIKCFLTEKIFLGQTSREGKRVDMGAMNKAQSSLQFSELGRNRATGSLSIALSIPAGVISTYYG